METVRERNPAVCMLWETLISVCFGNVCMGTDYICRIIDTTGPVFSVFFCIITTAGQKPLEKQLKLENSFSLERKNEKGW